MRILSITNEWRRAGPMEACAFVNMNMALMNGILEQRPDWRFVWAVNFRSEHEADVIRERVDDERIEVVFIGRDRNTAERCDILSGSFAADLSQWNGKRFYDLVYSTEPHILPYARDLLMDNPMFHVQVPFVASFGVAKAKPYAELRRYQARDLIGELDTFAALDADAFVLPSQHTMSAVQDIARRVLSPSIVLRQFAKKGQLIKLAIDVGRIPIAPNRDKPVLFNAGSLVSRKRPRDVLAILQSVRAAYGCDIIFTTGSKIPDWLEAADVEVRQPDHKGYYEGLADGDVFLCASRAESFGLANMEQLAAGQIGVFVKADWQRGLFPESYPFVAANFIEAKEMLAYIVSDFANVKAELAWVSDWVRKEYAVSRQASQFIELFERLDDEALCQFDYKKGLTALIKAVAGEFGDVVDLDVFIEQLNKVAESRQGKNRRFFIRAALRGLGKIV